MVRGDQSPLPPDAGTNPGLSIYSVSCAATGNCGAVGSYTDRSGNQQGLLLSETRGTWAPAMKATLPAGTGSNPEVTINSVSCVSAGNCSAVGSYNDSSGHEQGLLLETTQTLTVSLAGPGSGTVTSPPSGISCPGDCSHSYGSGTQMMLTATPAARSFFSGWSGACTGTGRCTVTTSAARTVTATFKLHLPDTKITKSKINRKHRTAKFSFKAIGATSGFQCALVRQPKKHHKHPKPKFSRCSSPKSYGHLKPGRYTFLVRALNATGPDRTPAKKSFRI